jgi:hypothetical protein
MTAGQPAPYRGPGRQVALVDLLDRVLAGGVVISGELTLRIADVDLVRISLRALVASVRAGWDDTYGAPLPREGAGAGPTPDGGTGTEGGPQ